jgi:fumarate hydratase, class II
MSATRSERDSFGPIEVPAERLWGAQTQRSLQYFAVSTEKMPVELVHALVRIKRASARVNSELGLLDATKAQAIATAADEVLAGQWPDEFPLSVWQTGSGTQTNMNVNEVLANRASELLGGARGSGRRVHPNDDVNRGQSSNDVFPTAMHVAASLVLAGHLQPALRGLRDTLDAKARAFADIIKIGRTHLHGRHAIDARTGVLGLRSAARSAASLPSMPTLPAAACSWLSGGTAVGTGLNTHPAVRRSASPLRMATRHRARASRQRAQQVRRARRPRRDRAARTAPSRRSRPRCIKIANDVRWLASGPRAGLGELRIPENEPGSSIMPGKVNPTQCEALTMVAAQVHGQRRGDQPRWRAAATSSSTCSSR